MFNTIYHMLCVYTVDESTRHMASCVSVCLSRTEMRHYLCFLSHWVYKEAPWAELSAAHRRRRYRGSVIKHLDPRILSPTPSSASNQKGSLCCYSPGQRASTLCPCEDWCLIIDATGNKTSPGTDGAPLGLAFCFQFADTGRPWTAARARSSLTSVRAGRSQSHIKLSENPKVPVRSVNSSIVPPTLTQRDRCNKAPPPVVQAAPPPLGPRVQWHPSAPPRAPWSVSDGETDAELCLLQGTWSPAPGRAEMMGLWLRRLITLKVQLVPTGSTKRF